jgi:serine/threonine protein kinase
VHVARWSGATNASADLVAKVAVAGAELTLHAENSALRAVEHPNVIAPIGFVDDTADVALVLPRAACSLSAHNGRLDDAEVAPLVFAVADALAELHRSGYAHRDVSAANILLLADATPVLSDFGRAAPVTPSSAAGDVADLARAATSVLRTADRTPLRDLLARAADEPCDAVALRECVEALGIEPSAIDVHAAEPIAVEPPTIVVD